jgi:hypothetical protein
MNPDFENTNKIMNGYWYTFHFLREEGSVKGYDEYPLIYCIQPDDTGFTDKHLNNFWALNLHHLNYQDRVNFIIAFDKVTNFLDEDIRRITTLDFLKNQIYPGCQAGFRRYNRKHIYNLYRIKNQCVPNYLSSDGKIMLSNPDEMVNKYLLEKSSNQTTESRK